MSGMKRKVCYNGPLLPYPLPHCYLIISGGRIYKRSRNPSKRPKNAETILTDIRRMWIYNKNPAQKFYTGIIEGEKENSKHGILLFYMSNNKLCK